MKTISGKVVSSKPISLSKAERAITGFIDIDNGASDAVYEYLRRTADAFQNLVKFHKELKTQTSHSKGNASQPALAETLAETPEVKKVQKREKNQGLKASQPQLAAANQSQLVGKKDQNGLNNEVAEVIDQKGKKKYKKERKQNEVRLDIVQSLDVKGEKIEYDVAGKEFDDLVVKTGKKKRKRDEDDVLEKSLEEDVKRENVGEALDGGKLDGLNNEVAEVIDQGGKESSGKKGKKKDKKERKQNEERMNVLQNLEDGKLDGLNNEVTEVIDQGGKESSGKKGKKKDKKERKQNEERLNISQSLENVGEALDDGKLDGLNNEVTEVIDQGAKGSSGKRGKKKDKKEIKENEERLDVKGEKIEYEDARKEFNGSVVKTGKNKRKRDADDVGEKSLEEDVMTEFTGEAVNDGKHDGKKKRKKMKA